MALLNEHLVRKATEEGVLKARKIRVDTTVIGANIHHPTDAGLICDGIRTVTRLVKQAQALGAGAYQRFQDRTRSVRKRLLAITKAPCLLMGSENIAAEWVAVPQELRQTVAFGAWRTSAH